MTGPERPTATAALVGGPVEYRLERQGDAAVVVFHGGHMRAGLPLGEDVFTDLGYTVLVPSRPGYGRTPVRSGRSPSGFADVTRELCHHLDMGNVAAVVGVSAGGRTAAAMAARHPDLVQGLILESAVGFVPWPDRRTRVAASVAFNAITEAATWGAVRTLLRFAPDLGLRAMLSGLSTEPPTDVVATLDNAERAALVALFSSMRSRRGFLNDLRSMRAVGPEIAQPTLVIASRKDGSVPFAHAESLTASVPQAELVVTEASSHFIWFGSDYDAVADRIRHFLARK